MRYELRQWDNGELLSEHPNAQGARIAALFHVTNGTKISWDRGALVFHGRVKGQIRFAVCCVDSSP